MASATEVPVLGVREAHVPPQEATPNDHHPDAACQVSPELEGAEDLLVLFERATRSDPALLSLVERGLGPRAHGSLELIMSFGRDFLKNIHLVLGWLQRPKGEIADSSLARRYQRGIALVLAHAVLGRVVGMMEDLVEERELRRKFGCDLTGPWQFNVLQRYPRDLLGALVRAVVNPGAMKQLEIIVCREVAARLGMPRTANGLAQEVRRYVPLFTELAREAYEVNLSKDVLPEAPSPLTNYPFQIPGSSYHTSPA